MDKLRKYRRREQTPIIAVRLDLDTEGFTYEQWGATQRCKPGDWIVKGLKETYTIDAESFARTYREVSPGVYEKTGFVWAEEAQAAGTILTREGATDYQPGDFLVYNDRDGKDGYAMVAESFHTLYEATE